MKRLTRNLLDRSRQAYLLGLEVFNKPTIEYRIEGFCFFYTNAWELLCKARLVEVTRSEQSIYYRKARGKPRRTLSLRDALERAIPEQNDPVRRNVERIAELRDNATHFLIPELEVVYAGLFQAGSLNYVDHLRTWFGRSIGDHVTPPLLSLVWDLRDLQPKVIEKRHGADARKFIERQIAEVRAMEEQVADRRFSITVEYKLVLTKTPKEADISLGAGPGGALVAQPIYVPKDVSLTHPYKEKAAVKAVRSKLPAGTEFTSYGFQAVSHKMNVKKADSNLHYLFKQSGTHCYSDALVALMVEKILAESGYLDRAKESYRHHLRAMKTRTRGPKRK